MLIFLFTNRLLFQPINNPWQYNKQCTFSYKFSCGYGSNRAFGMLINVVLNLNSSISNAPPSPSRKPLCISISNTSSGLMLANPNDLLQLLMKIICFPIRKFLILTKIANEAKL
jgi:hypothetical protein